MPVRRRFQLAPLLLLALAAAPAPARAEAGALLDALMAHALIVPGLPGGPRPEDYDAATLRPAQLRDCLVDAHGLDERLAGLARRLGAITADAADLEAGRAELERARAALSRDPADIDRFNRRIATQARRADVVRAQATAYQRDADGERVRIDEFQRVCAARRFFASDLRQVAAELPFAVARHVR